MSVQIDEIRKELTSLKCIVCKRYLSVPPIYYTPSGEYRCGRCSFVKENMSFRAELYEKMAHRVTFPCIHQDCDAEISWDDVPNHEANCSQRMFDCPFDCDAQVGGNKLVQHFNSVHESLKLSKRSLANESVLKNGEKVKLFYIISEGEPFVVMFLPGNREFKFGSTATPNFISDTAVTTASAFGASRSRSMRKASGWAPNEKKSSFTPVTCLATFVPVCSKSYVTSPVSGNTFTLSSATTAQPQTIGTPPLFGQGSPSPIFSFTTISPSGTPVPSSTETTNSSQQISSSYLGQVSISRQSGLSVFSLFPSKPFTSFTLTFTSNNWKLDINDQRVEPFISKEHCRKCWFEFCKSDSHKPYSIHVNLDEFVTTKFKSNALFRLFQCDDVTFSITVHNKSIVDELEKGPYVELSKIVQGSLECPICTQIMIPPIFVCATGHAICTTCKLLLKECPTCKAAYAGTRSFVLEELYERSKLICSTSENNECDFVGDLDQINIHDRCHETQ